MLERASQLAQRLLRRILDDYRKETGLALVIPLNDDIGDARRIFIKNWPGKLEIGAPQVWKLAGGQRVGFGEYRSPPRALATSSPRREDRSERHSPLHRYSGYAGCKMQ